MSLVRSPILDIDVDLNGIPQSLAGSSISANITRCILLQDIEANIKLNYNSRKWLSSILYKWLLSGNERILQDANAETEAVIRYYHHVNRGRTITPEDENKLRIEKKNLGLKIKSLNFLMGDGPGLHAKCPHRFNRGQTLPPFVHGHQARNRIIATGNNEVLAGFDASQQFRQMRFGLGHLYGNGHGNSFVTLAFTAQTSSNTNIGQ